MASIEKRHGANGQVTWRARYRTPSGAQRNKSFLKKVDAQRFLATVQHNKSAGSYVDPVLAKVTLGEWSKRWIEAQAHLKPSTHERYAGILRKQILPKWSSVRLGDVTHVDVQHWITTLAVTYSPSTVAKIHRVLSLILDMAVKDGRLARNVSQGVNLPRPYKPEHRYLNHNQVEDLANECGYPSDPSKHSSLDARANETYRLVVLFLAYTGVRFGEMAALRVGRLDLPRQRAVIVQSVTPVQGKGLVWGTTKTHQRREVPIPRFLCTELAEHIKNKNLDDLAFGGIRNGQPLRVSTFRRAFDVAAAAIGMPDLHPHQLRHTAASLAIASGADVKVVQQMLGHASATMTLDTYGHLLEDRLNEVADAMDAAREDARQRLARVSATARVSKLCPDSPGAGHEEAAPPSVSAGQDRFSDLYPRRDSNPRYRLERAAC